MCEKRKLTQTLLALIMFAGFLSGCQQAPVETPAESGTLETLTAGLEYLSPEAFMEEAFQRLALRSPQMVTEVGLANLFDVRNTALDSYDLQDRLLTQSFEIELLALAGRINQARLDEKVQSDLRVFIWYLEDRIALHPYQWLEFPLWDERGSLTDQYVYLLMAQQPFEDEADVEDFLGRLEAIGPQIDQLISFFQARQEQGIQMPYLLYAEVMEEMGAHDWEVGWKTPFITVLAVRLQNMNEISHEKRESYYERGGQIADEVILPAFDRLVDALYALAGDTSDAVGLSAQPQGLEGYQALLDRETTLGIPAAELFSFSEARVAVLGEAVRSAAAEEGYDPDMPLQEIFRQARVDRDYALGLDIFVTLRNLMLDAEMEMDSVFETRIENDLVMVPVFEGGFYEPAALDGSRRAAFYGGFYGQEAHFGLPTKVYHETFPGRHYLATVIQSSDLTLLRKVILFPIYDEGWALYAEHLAWEMGLFDGDPNANLARLQSELIAAAKVVADVGIHTLGWDAQEAARYLVDYAGVDRAVANEMILLQIAHPAEAVAGYVGYDFIRSLRESVQEKMGEGFDLMAFHTAVLSGGSLPLPLLEEQVWGEMELDGVVDE